MANKLKVVIDTNVLLVSISDRSSSHWLFQAVIEKRIEVFVTTGILNEYEEKISEHWSPEVAMAIIRMLLEFSNVYLTTVWYNLGLIMQDEDDNKFCDCAFASNADYIITNDKHFNILSAISFPKIKTIRLEDLQKILNEF
jgi:putative PIN family toxin of toxin-antitoxin system